MRLVTGSARQPPASPRSVRLGWVVSSWWALGRPIPHSQQMRLVSQRCGVQPDALRARSTRVGERGSRTTGVLSAAQVQIAAKGPAWGVDVGGSQFTRGRHGFVRQLATVGASVSAKAALLSYDAARPRSTCGALRYLIIGSALVTSFSHGRCVLSMGGVDDDGEVVAAVTVREVN
jgi:hypothetical protein